MAQKTDNTLNTDNATAFVSGSNKWTGSEVQGILGDLIDSKGFGNSATFTSAITFTEPFTVMTLSISSNQTFTRVTTGAKIGSVTLARVTANGTNTVSFNAAFKKSSTSLTYDTTNAVVNAIYFWYDGTDYWYSIDRAI